MARKNKRGGRSGMYARPVVAGNSTLTVDLTNTLISQDAYNAWKESVGGMERHYILLTPSKLRSLARLTAADALKITSVIVAPSNDTASSIMDEAITVDFTDGQNFICADKVRPTKCVPSPLSPAGRYQDATSSVELVKIYCPLVNTGNAGSGGTPVYMLAQKIVVNLSVRQDAGVVTISN